MNDSESLMDLINWTLQHHPEVVKASPGFSGNVSLQLWGYTLEFQVGPAGSGTYYINDTSG